jgi:hypothetical protein
MDALARQSAEDETRVVFPDETTPAQFLSLRAAGTTEYKWSADSEKVMQRGAHEEDEVAALLERETESPIRPVDPDDSDIAARLRRDPKTGEPLLFPDEVKEPRRKRAASPHFRPAASEPTVSLREFTLESESKGAGSAHPVYCACTDPGPRVDPDTGLDAEAPFHLDLRSLATSLTVDTSTPTASPGTPIEQAKST